MNKFGRSLSLLSLALVVLLAGCSLGGNMFKYEITVDPAAAAEVDRASGKVKAGTAVTFTLTPNEGYEFVGWDGDDVELQEGDAEGEWTFAMPKKNVTLKAVFEAVEDPEEPEPVDEEALVQAVRDARDQEELEDFMDALEALQDAGLLTDVVEEHGPAYLEQARYFPKFGEFALNNTAFMPYMKDAADIQELIIDPVNEWVAEAIDAINGARMPYETATAWQRFKQQGKSLLDFEGFELTDVADEVVEELLVEYPPLSVADIRDIVYGAYVKGQVDALFESDAQKALREGVDQTKIDEVAELVAEVAIDELKAELEAAVAKAQGLWDEWIVKQINELEGEALASWIVRNMTITQFNDLSAARRAEVAGFLSKAHFESIEEFIEAVVAEVGKYLELLGAVNAAATNSQMVVALEGLGYYKEDYGVFANYVDIEDPDTQLKIAEDMFLEVPFETISDIADELQSLIEEYWTEPVPSTL